MPSVRKILVFVAAACTALAAPVVTIPAGTPIRLAVARNVSSAVDRQGDAVTLEVLEGVRVNGVEVVAPRSQVTATVVTAEPLRSGSKGGVLQFKIRALAVRPGVSIPLGLAAPVPVPASAATAGSIPVRIAGNATPVYSLVGARTEAVMVRGTQLTVFVQKAVVIDVGKTSPAGGGTTAPRVLTNEDIVAMHRAGQTEDAIIAAIRGTPGNYRLAAADLAILKKAGLTSRILEAMFAARGK